MVLPIALNERLLALKMVQYDMILCIRQAFTFDEATEQYFPIVIQGDYLGRGYVLVKPDVLNKKFLIRDAAMGAVDTIPFTTLRETLPILRDNICNRLVVRYLPSTQW